MLGNDMALYNELKRLKLDSMVVTSPENTFYITSYMNPDSVIVVKHNAIYYLTDNRYVTESKRYLAANIHIMVCENNIEHMLLNLLAEDRVVGFESTLEYGKYEKYFVKNRINAIPVYDFLTISRQCKNVAEKALIQQAAHINDLTYAKVLEEICIGMTERELRDRIESYFRAFGADGLAFDTIVAFGEGAAEPHHRVGNRQLKFGDAILIDMGCNLKGYCSDVTRTFFIGTVDNEVRLLYNKVLDCNRMGIELLSDGVDTASVDRKVRDRLRQDRLDQYFTHSLGHGVGIQIHEQPYLSSHSADILRRGNVVTIEPGLYFPGRVGIRIEDLVYIGDRGVEVLSTFEKEIIEL